MTASGTGSVVATIASNAVTYAKLQQVAAVSLVGNPTGSLANAQGITLGSGLSFSGTTLIATGSGGSVSSVTFTGDGTVLSSTPSSAVTTTGTLSATLNAQTKNTVLAGPTLGSNAAPTFRSLIASDMPAFTGGNVTSSAGSGTLTIGSSQVTNTMLAGSIAASKLTGTDIATVGTITAGTWHGSVIGGTYGGTGVNNGSFTITLAGNLTTSGAFNTTLTSTATTNATLPAGTTTLVPTTGTGASGTWGINVSGNAATVTTNANLSGDVTSSGNSTTVAANAVTYAKLQQVAAVSLVGNPTGSLANAQGITLGSGLFFSGSTLYATGSGGSVTSVTFTGDGTIFSSAPSTAVITSGTLNATLLNAGAYTILGNNTSSSTTPAYSTSPRISGSMTANNFISNVATGTAPFTVSSTTNVANLNASSLNGATFASPGAIGSGSASTGAFTTVSASGNTNFTGTSNVVGTITTGIWNGTVISTTYGGLGGNFGSSSGALSISSGTVSAGTLSVANGGTGQTTTNAAFTSFFETVATTLGDLVYGGSSGIPSRLAGNTTDTPQFLTSTGVSSLATAPSWTGSTGTGSVVLATGPTITLANATGLPLTTGVTGILGATNGGTGVTSVTTTPTASSFAGWDANKNLSTNNCIEGYALTTTASGTTTLTSSSAYEQFFTGTLSQTVQLPVASTLVNGMQWLIVNLSSGNITIQSSGGNTIQVLTSNSQAVITCFNTAGGTGIASWSSTYQLLTGSRGGSGTVTSVTFTGDGTIFSSTPSSAVTTSGTLNASLLNAGAYTILGNASSGSATPTYSSSPTVSGTITAQYFNSSGYAYEMVGVPVLAFPNADNSSIAVGLFSLPNQTSTSLNNTALGAYTGNSVSSGTNNIFLGYGSGYNGGTNAITSGGSNILIGYNITAPTATTSNYMNIGGAITATSLYGTPAVTIPGTLSITGNVGIGTTPSANTLDIGPSNTGIHIPSGTGGSNVLWNSGGVLTWGSTALTVTGSVTASGATGYLPYFTSGTTLGDSAIYQDGSGHIGIGTASPASYALNVVGAINVGVLNTSAGALILNGATSGSATIQAASVAGSSTITLPSATCTLSGVNITQTFTGGQVAGVSTLTSSSNSVAVNLALNNNFSLTMTENTTLANPSNMTAGQSGQILLTQASSASYSLAFGSYWVSASGTALAMSTTHSAVNLLSYYVADSTHIWYSLNTAGVA